MVPVKMENVCFLYNCDKAIISKGDMYCSLHQPKKKNKPTKRCRQEHQEKCILINCVKETNNDALYCVFHKPKTIRAPKRKHEYTLQENRTVTIIEPTVNTNNDLYYIVHVDNCPECSISKMCDFHDALGLF